MMCMHDFIMNEYRLRLSLCTDVFAGKTTNPPNWPYFRLGLFCAPTCCSHWYEHCSDLSRVMTVLLAKEWVSVTTGPCYSSPASLYHYRVIRNILPVMMMRMMMMMMMMMNHLTPRRPRFLRKKRKKNTNKLTLMELLERNYKAKSRLKK